ncbi:MAG: RagB/SusD family nutrient uptake outer membrane protein, partial [Bacteroidota bacterium]
MKRLLKNIYLLLLVMAAVASCHKIEVPVSTELTPSIFPQDSNQFIQASGPAYVALRGNWSTEYFFQQCYSTDEGIMEARGGNWFDGAQNQQMHYHSW